MSNTEAAAPTKDVAKILAWLVTVVGVVIFVIGIVAYGGISAQLKAQGITVEEVTPQNPGALAGKDVAGPFTALAQVNGIQQHTITSTSCIQADGTPLFPGGRTFGQIPRAATNDGKVYSSDVKVSDGTSTDGMDHAKGDPVSAIDACSFNTRTTAEQSGWLQASLMLPVLAFAVAVFIIGMGLTVFVIGLALLNNGRKNSSVKVIEETKEAVKEAKE